MVSGPCTHISNPARGCGGHTRPQSAAASPSPELERARLTRRFRHALPPMVQLETGRWAVGALASQSLGPLNTSSIPDLSLDFWIHGLRGLGLDATTCAAMHGHGLPVSPPVKPYRSAGLQGWMDGRSSRPKRHPSRSGHECLLGSIF